MIQFTYRISNAPNIYGLLAKLLWSRWLDIGQVIFFSVFMDRDEYMFRSLLMNLEVTSLSHGRADGLFIFYQSYYSILVEFSRF